MRHWVHLRDWSLQELSELVALARALKRGEGRAEAEAIRGKIMSMVYFNPSLRTRVSFEAAMFRYGGQALTLSVGGDTWQLEYRDGAVMDGAAAEHIREAAPVLSRYCNVLGVRTFARMKDAAEDAADGVIRAFAKFATVPVVNLESAIDHPCQGLADRVTMEEKLGKMAGRRFVLTWAPHVKGLPMAVPHAAILAAASAGMEVTIAQPPGYNLNTDVLDKARQWCEAHGAALTITHEQREACRAADVLYVKSWGSPAFYGNEAGQRDSFRQHAEWMVKQDHLGPETFLMHCLPVRRNVVIADAALDDRRCIVVDEAENRMWAQAAILCRLLESK